MRGQSMKVTILTENTVYRRGYLGEHGLSLWIEHENGKYLFDTGQSSVFCKNAQRRGIDLKSADGIILSHGHYDHCGGLLSWIKGSEKPPFGEVPVYISQEAFAPKYTGTAEKLREIGMGFLKEDYKINFRWTQPGKTEISQDIYLVKGITFDTAFEPKPEGFFYMTKDGELAADDMKDEQLLVIRTGQGLSVFAGCAHGGIINCLSAVRREFPKEHIYSLIAGMHLKSCGIQRLNETLCALEQSEIELLMPLHCTGIAEIGQMKARMGKRCVLGETGMQFTI